jgi:hypothetical protein
VLTVLTQKTRLQRSQIVAKTDARLRFQLGKQ